MGLHTKYRPKSLDEVFGNDTVKESLQSIFDRKDKESGLSFLFTGSAGCGKTTMAHVLKSMFNVYDEDFHYYNASNTRGIDTIREIDSAMNYAPWAGKYKMYVIDECHGITQTGQEAFLKTIEEPPAHVIFVLCTTEPEKLKPTTKRRLLHFEMELLSSRQIVQLLEETCKSENVDDYPKQILRKISTICNGSAGQALKFLGEVIGITDIEKAESILTSITIDELSVKALCQTLIDTQMSPKDKWVKLRDSLKDFKGDIETTRYGILGYLSAVMLNNSVPSPFLAEVMSCYTDSFMYSGKGGLVLATYLACSASSK